MRRKLSMTGHGDIQAKGLTSKSKHDENEINTNHPQQADEDDTLQALGLKDHVEALSASDKLNSGDDIRIGRGGGCSQLGLGLAIVLRDCQKPCNSKSSRVGGIDDAVDQVKPSEPEALERGLLSNMREQVHSETKDKK